MKTIKILTIIFVVMSAVLTGCKSAQPKTAGEDSGYPIDGSYPVPNASGSSAGEAAYPIFPIDATQLTKVPVWTLTRYSINGQEESHGTKTFTFTANGAYTLTTDSGLEEGHWYVTTTTDPLLVLVTSTDQEINYVIINLTPEGMILNIEQNSAIIEEQYQPAD